MVKLSIVLCVLAMWAVVGVNCKHHHQAPAPAPSVDCSTIIFSMADCLSFVSNDSTVSKPEGECCPGLKTVLDTDAKCLCEVFTNSAELGIVLNVSRALSLPSVCGVSAPSISKCGIPGLSDDSPAASPKSPESPAPTTPTPVTPAAAPTTGGSVEAPSPPPATSPKSPTAPAPTSPTTVTPAAAPTTGEIVEGPAPGTGETVEGPAPSTEDNVEAPAPSFSGASANPISFLALLVSPIVAYALTSGCRVVS